MSQISKLVLVSIISLFLGLAAASFGGSRIFLPGLLEGAVITAVITVGGSVLAVIAALTAALGRMYGPLPVRWLATTYVELFRGTSALVQLFWMFFVLPHFGIFLAPVLVGIIALGLNIGAYGAEVIRGAIISIPRGQHEAALALNMSGSTKFIRIILPQAYVRMLPPWGNLLIELLKATSLVSLITVGDLTFRAQQMNQITFKTTQIFTLTLLFYLAFAILITVIIRTLEQRAASGLARGRL